MSVSLRSICGVIPLALAVAIGTAGCTPTDDGANPTAGSSTTISSAPSAPATSPTHRQDKVKPVASCTDDSWPDGWITPPQTDQLSKAADILGLSHRQIKEGARYGYVNCRKPVARFDIVTVPGHGRCVVMNNQQDTGDPTTAVVVCSIAVRSHESPSGTPIPSRMSSVPA